MAKTREVDKHIIKALNEITTPIVIRDNVRVIFADKGRYQSRFEHIADKKHHLKVSDIELVVPILKKPLAYNESNKKDCSKCYYGKRKGNPKTKYLKIVVDFREVRLGRIVTIYPVKRLDA